MALGTLTIIDRVELDNGQELLKVSFAGDGDYHTDGTLVAEVNRVLKAALVLEAAVAPVNVKGVRTPEVVNIIPGNCGAYFPTWVAAGLKVLIGGSASRAEVANHGNLSGTTFNLSLICV